MLNFNSTIVNTEIIPAVQKVVPIKVSTRALPNKNIRFKITDIIIIIGWLIWIAFCIWYIQSVVVNYIELQNTPTTALSFNETLALEFPGITICNYKSYSTKTTCSDCSLDLVDIYRLSITGTKGGIEEGTINAQKKSITEGTHVYSCYKINDDPDKLFIAKKKGLSGSISFQFQVPSVSQGRQGLQVTFHEPGSEPSMYQETQFAVPGVENYFSLTKVVRTVLDMNYDTSLAIRNVTWDAYVSTIAVTSLPTNNVIVTVTYGSMNVNNIDEVVTNTIPSLLGDIAGMIGLTMGLDLLKLCRGILEIPYSFNEKSVKNLWKIFN